MTNKRHPIRTELLLWAAILGGLTVLGVVFLRVSGINPDNGFSPAILLIAYASSVAALLTTGWLYGPGAVGKLLRRIGYAGRSRRVYVAAFMVSFGVVAAAHAIWLALGHALSGPWFDVSGLAPAFGSIFAGSLGEEIGWRGFSQPLLERRLSVFWASVAVGFIWATWHCWPLLAPGGTDHRWLLDVGLTYARLVPTAVFYGWLYYASGRSLLVVMLAHAAHNIAVATMPVTDTAYGLAALVAALYVLVAAVVVLTARKQLFSRVASPHDSAYSNRY